MQSRTMQDMFDLNTTIDQLKHTLSKGYNFTVEPTELKTSIHLFSQANEFPQIAREEFMQFNNAVRREMQAMIERLVEKRDKMTLQILANQPKVPAIEDPEKGPNEEDFKCYGIDCDTCLVSYCPNLSKPKTESDEGI